MSIHHETQVDRAATIFGLRPSRAAACPRVVAGLRCAAYRYDHRLCMCQTYRRLLDHGRCWLDTTGRHVVTGEPYQINTNEFIRFVDACAEVGVKVRLDARSLWSPGNTLLIVVTRPDDVRPTAETDTP